MAEGAVPVKPKSAVKTSSKEPRLRIEMVPFKSWAVNVRAVVAKDLWDSMRYYFKATLEQSGFMRPLDMPRPDWKTPLVCATCQEKSETLELHEHWEYDDIKRVQKLTRLSPICERCHNVMHFGRASQLGLREEAYAQLRKVNSMTNRQADAHIAEAYRIWEERCAHSYEVDFSYLANIVSEGMIHLNWLDRPKFWSGNRLDAIEWARDRLKAKDVVILDTETTGLVSGPHKNDRAEVIELAIISTSGKVLYESRFKSKYKVPKRTTAIHGITNEDLVNCPTFAEEIPKITALIEGKTVLSYNDRFDSAVITQTCAMHKAPPPDCKWECVMRMYRAFLKGPRFVKLPGASHGAVADCKATLKLIRLIAKG